MTEPEFSRAIRLDTLGAAPRTLTIAAEATERAALARRFGLLALDSLEAELSLAAEGEVVTLTGRLLAKATQACIASGAPVPAAIDEPIALAFRPAPTAGQPDEEIELGQNDMEVMFHDGAAIDVGEAVAQSLALALDPYPRAPDAEAALNEAGVKSETEAGPFAALAALKAKPKG
ncbi:MAG: YceD family protein [Sphingosinicella sp.]